MQGIEKKIVSVLKELSQHITKEDFIEILNLVETHGEYGIAMESLCSVLEENEIPIPNQTLEVIIDLFREMDFGNDTLTYYRQHLSTQK